MSMTRPNWDTYFFNIAKLASERSTCLRRQVGSVIIKNNNILSTGYNGSPIKTTHCTEIGCLREKLNVPSGQKHELCRGVHAEQNAIIQAAKHGHSINNATIYTTLFPCSICLKMIINSGIKEIYYLERYNDTLCKEILNDCQEYIILHRFDPETEIEETHK